MAVQKFVEGGGLKAGERILKAESFRRLAGKVSGHGFGGGVGIAIGEGGRGHGCPREKVKSACVTLPKTSGKGKRAFGAERAGSRVVSHGALPLRRWTCRRNTWTGLDISADMDKRVRFLRKKSRSGAQEVIMSDEKTLVGAVKTEQGVEVKGMLMQPVVEKCEGCDRVRTFEEQQFCGSYPNPAKKWFDGRCNFATHIKTESGKAAKVNPLKASKRAAKGR